MVRSPHTTLSSSPAKKKNSIFPAWNSWSDWKYRNPVLSFVGKHVISGMVSTLGSIVVYIVALLIIFRIYKNKKDKDKDMDTAISTALQLRSPYVYHGMDKL